jgi:spoIIIJ-associated protein
MEWLETTARTVEEAKDLLLDQLGVDADDAEFEVIEEPKPGLFGRVRGEARVRARVRPAPVRQKTDRRRKDKRDAPAGDAIGTVGHEGTDVADTAPSSAEPAPRAGRPPRATERAPRPASDRPADDRPAVSVEQVGAEAQRFTEGLLEAFGVEHRTEVVTEGDHIEVRVHGEQLGLLVGPRGSTLQALQELVRIVAQRKLGDHDSRLTVDVGGYRQRRRDALERFARQVADDVLGSGEPRAMEPMTSSDRKVVHDTLSQIEGITTRSEGDDPNRRVVVLPAVHAGHD